MSATERLKVTIRPARAEDRENVFELVSKIWGEDDYIPQTWDKWLGEREGCLLVGELQGRAIALGHLAVGCEAGETSGDWWLEGLRVHPDFQGQGVGSQLFEALAGWYQTHGGGRLRLATTGRNLAMQALCTQYGLVRVGEYSDFEAGLLEGEAHFEAVQLEKSSAALRLAQGNPVNELTGGYLDLGRGWTSPRLRHIQAAVQEEQAYWWHGRKGLVVCCEDPEEEVGVVQLVGLAACARKDLSDLLLDFRRLGRQRGYERVGWFAPLIPELDEILQSSGYERTWEGSAYLRSASK